MPEQFYVRILYPEDRALPEHLLRGWACDHLADGGLALGSDQITLDEAVAILTDAGLVTCHKDTPVDFDLDASDVIEDLRGRFDDVQACLICGGPLMKIGTLGRTRHCRCRNCGMDSTISG